MKPQFAESALTSELRTGVHKRAFSRRIAGDGRDGSEFERHKASNLSLQVVRLTAYWLHGQATAVGENAHGAAPLLSPQSFRGQGVQTKKTYKDKTHGGMEAVSFFLEQVLIRPKPGPVAMKLLQEADGRA